MTDLNLDELERLLAEATAHSDPQQFTKYDNRLHSAAVNALPALIAAARERDALKADEDALRDIECPECEGRGCQECATP